MSNVEFNIDSKMSNVQNAGAGLNASADSAILLSGGSLPDMSTGVNDTVMLYATFGAVTGTFTWGLTGSAF